MTGVRQGVRARASAARGARRSWRLPCSAVRCATRSYTRQLKELAATAETGGDGGKLEAARDTWQRALDLLPPSSRQHAVVRERVAELTQRIAATPGAKRRRTDRRPVVEAGRGGGGPRRRLRAGQAEVPGARSDQGEHVLLDVRLFGLYWSPFGWALAAGLVSRSTSTRWGTSPS